MWESCGSESLLHCLTSLFTDQSVDLDPYHVTIETFCVILIVYLLFKKPTKIQKKDDRLTDKEIEEVVKDWEPLPLCPEIKEHHLLREQTTPVATSGTADLVVELEDGTELKNFATTNFLNLATDGEIKAAAVKSLRTYGCGACGPRGFYGTMDIHLKLEDELAKFMGTEEAIIYASGYATIASTIPSFSKRFDVIFCDDGVSHAIQTGCSLSRSKIIYYKHNDMEDLKRVLESHEKQAPRAGKEVYRKFLVFEGLSKTYGDIAPLPEILELRSKYFFRCIMDDSYGIGVLGPTGRGTAEHFGLAVTKIDIVTGELGHAFGSLGGFCIGTKHVVFHQRLNSSGYVFSASAPPYLVSGAVCSLSKIMEGNGKYQKRLKENIRVMKESLLDSEEFGISVRGDVDHSPTIHLELTHLPYKSYPQRNHNNSLLQKIVDVAKENGFLLTRAKYVEELDALCPKPSIHLCVTAAHHPTDIQALCQLIKKAASSLEM